MNLKKTILTLLGFTLMHAAYAQSASDDCDAPLMFKKPGENPTVTCSWKKKVSPTLDDKLPLEIIEWDPEVKSARANCLFAPAIGSNGKVSKLVNISGTVVHNLSIHENTATFDVLNIRYTIWSKLEIYFEINNNEGFWSHFEGAEFNPDDKITCTFTLI